QVGRFAGDAVELDDSEILAGFEGGNVFVADIETAEEKAIEGARHLIERGFELGGDEMRAVSKQGALAVVAGVRELEGFAVEENAIEFVMMASKEGLGLHAKSRVAPDQLLKSVNA